jgi:4-amino-4-deoxy-L-arabinose transferase-like glycosyltransferase
LNSSAPIRPDVDCGVQYGSHLEDQPRSRAHVSRWFIAVVILVSYAGYFSGQGALGLVGPDEPRYVSIARAMERTGDWVTPRLNGDPWFEKPVLYYWAAATSFKLFGENDFAARLPSALAAMLAAAAIAWMAWRFYGGVTSLLALAMFPTCIATLAFARAATPDMLFCGTLAAAMACGAALLFEENPNFWQRAGFGFFLGAATLAKGPAAVVLAGGSVAIWALCSRKWTRAFRLAHPLSVFIFLLVSVPWYFLCARRNPDFLHVFILQHNFERFLTPVFHHVRPWWFFLPYLVLWTLPWSALFFALGRRAAAIPQWRERFTRPGFYFACWSVFIVIFFSASKSKLPGYILPAAPPLLLLLAAAANRIRRICDDAARGVVMGLGATWLALVVGAGFWIHRQLPRSAFASLQPQVIWYCLAVAAAGGAIIAVLGSARKIPAAFLVNASLIACLLIAANWLIVPRIDPLVSSRATAKAFLSAETGGGNSGEKIPAGSLGAYHLDRAWQFGLEYYLGHPIPEWTPEAGGSFWLFTDEAGCRDIRRRGMECTPVQETAPKAWLVRIQPATRRIASL